MPEIAPSYWTDMQTAVDRYRMKTTNAPIGAARHGGQAA